MQVGRLAVTKLLDAIGLAEITAGLPRRIHGVIDQHVACSPDRVALIEDGASWSYRELDRSVAEIAAGLRELGVRAGERVRVRQGDGEAIVEVGIDERLPEGCVRLAASSNAASAVQFSLTMIIRSPALTPSSRRPAAISATDRSSSR